MTDNFTILLEKLRQHRSLYIIVNGTQHSVSLSGKLFDTKITWISERENVGAADNGMFSASLSVSEKETVHKMLKLGDPDQWKGNEYEFGVS